MGMLLLLRGETGGVEERCRCGSAFADDHVHHRLMLLLLCGISMMRPAAGKECNHGTAGLILKACEPLPRSSISLLPPLLHREVQLLLLVSCMLRCGGRALRRCVNGAP